MCDALDSFLDVPSILLESPCGSGKTLAVLLPSLRRLALNVRHFVIFTAPTRELCAQHFEFARLLL